MRKRERGCPWYSKARMTAIASDDAGMMITTGDDFAGANGVY